MKRFQLYGLGNALVDIFIEVSDEEVAALFAVHPLNVEPVAWVAERKGVLSTFFWMLTLWAYARYAERPGFLRYGLVVLGMILGLMAKPMLVTLPAVLLLLGIWPLRRLGSADRFNLGILVRRIGEKLPFVALAAGFSVVAVLAQRGAGQKCLIACVVEWIALRLHRDRDEELVFRMAGGLQQVRCPRRVRRKGEGDPAG